MEHASKWIQEIIAQKWWKLSVFQVTFCLVSFRYGKKYLMRHVSNGRPYLNRRSRCTKFQWSRCHTHLKTLWTADSAELWYDGKEACARWILPQRCRGHKEDLILCVTVNKRSVSCSSKTALYIPVGRNFLLNDMGWLEDWQMPSLSAYRMWSKESSNRGTPKALLRDSTRIHLLISALMQKKERKRRSG